MLNRLENTAVESREMADFPSRLRTSDPPALVSHRPHRIQRKDVAVINLKRAKELRFMFYQDILIVLEHGNVQVYAGMRKIVKFIQNQILHPTFQIVISQLAIFDYRKVGNKHVLPTPYSQEITSVLSAYVMWDSKVAELVYNYK